MRKKAIIYILVVISVFTLLMPKLMAQKSTFNQKPCLYDGKIEPSSGTIKIPYTASVYYYDPDGKKPNKIQIIIDDINYPLKRSQGQPNKGLYTAKLTLPPGEHNYYFEAEDDNGALVRFPRYGTKKGPLVGITKPAQLTKGGVLRKSGTDKTLYTYTIHYFDPQDNPPQKIYVVVDGITYPMSLHKGRRSNGTYIAVLTLPAGSHAYYFKAMDAQGNCISLPEDGFIRGPEVVESANSSPNLFDVKLEPIIGYKSQAFTYLVTYLDKDFDPPSLIHIVIDGESYPLKLKAGKNYNGIYYFRTKQYLGNYHNYYFYCEDGRGGSCRIPATGTFHGPVVVK